MQRLIANILCFSAILFVPLWACLVVLFLIILFFGYVEILGYFAVVDVLYGIGGGALHNHAYLLLGVIVYLVMLKIRPYIKMY
jgi:hypothetical protein